MPSARTLATIVGLVASAVLGTAAPARGQDCPSGTFLNYDGAVYLAVQVPAGATVPAGERLGDGTLDQPKGDDACKRERADVGVRGIAGVDPRAVVTVEDRAGVVFALGGRCTGIPEADRVPCLLEPLRFGSTSYTAVSYPAEPQPQGNLPSGAQLGDGELGGEQVAVVELAGIDPALAVGISGRPETAFVAPGVCPYERFASDEALDDLRRCLEGPLWLVFGAGATAGAAITAASDRPVAAELSGAILALARLDVAADVVPDDDAQATTVGTIEPGADGRVNLEIVLPDLDPGLYEAVVTCEPCAASFDGETVFPAGSVLVLAVGEVDDDGSGGGSGPRIVAIVVGAIFFGLMILAVVAWRRGWHRRSGARRP